MRWMKLPKFYKPEISDDDSLELRRQALKENFKRASILAIVTICFEIVFSAIDVSALLMNVHETFHYWIYLLMYSTMILGNLLLLIFVKIPHDIENYSIDRIRRLETGLLLYIVFNMTWGSIVTLLDQRLYGQLTVFMVNVIFCSVVFITSFRQMLFPYAVSTAVLMIGLLFTQPSPDILIGHYVNLSVFICIAWVSARLLYRSFCVNWLSKMALEQSNQLLAAESAHNQTINDKLNQANFQLRQLSLIDELTGIANRRGLRNFISHVFEQPEVAIKELAVAMIDIDYFKNYNDTYGHPAGDRILMQVAQLLDSALQPPMEIVARWGGEEFILLSFNPDRETFYDRVETIRLQVEKLGIINELAEPYGVVTISIGTSLMPASAPSDVAKVIGDADVAMYLAKKGGRNQIRGF